MLPFLLYKKDWFALKQREKHMRLGHYDLKICAIGALGGEHNLKIEKVINNNVVSSRDKDGREVVLMGCGLAFHKKRGEDVDNSKIEKIFYADNEDRNSRLVQLFSHITEEHIQLSSDIIDYARTHLETHLSDNLYISLTDHISMAIERMKSGIQLKNSLLGEIQKNYEAEFEVGKHAVDMMNQRLDLNLTYEEAGFIALHLVNARVVREG